MTLSRDEFSAVCTALNIVLRTQAHELESKYEVDNGEYLIEDSELLLRRFEDEIREPIFRMLPIEEDDECGSFPTWLNRKNSERAHC